MNGTRWFGLVVSIVALAAVAWPLQKHPASGDDFPLSTYPPSLQWVVVATPLYQGVALERALMLGEVSWSLLGHVTYLGVLGVLGIVGASRRIGRLLLT